MRGSGISKCSGNSCCVLAFDIRRMDSDCGYSQLCIGISTMAKSLCFSCKSQQQREGEGVDYAVPLHCIPNHITAHTLFSADRLLFCGIGDGFHGYELLRCALFGTLLHLSPNTCISRISFLSFLSSHYCLHIPPSILSPLYSSFSLVTAADRSLLVLFQFPLDPSMPACTISPCALHLKWLLTTSCWSWSCTSSTPVKTAWCLHWLPRAQRIATLDMECPITVLLTSASDIKSWTARRPTASAPHSHALN